MASWKKIIVSGSAAQLASLSLDTALTVANGGTGASSLTDGGILLGSGTAAITALGQATNGQIPIGSTGADPVLGTITGGSGIAVTNGAGSIEIAADGLGSGTVTSLLFEDGISGGTITTTGTGSLDINSLSTTLSATAATGDLLGIADIDASNATKKITVDNVLKAGTVTIGSTSVGVNGSAVTAFSGLTTLVNDSAVADTQLTGSFTGSFTGEFVGTTDLPDLSSGNGLTGGPYDGSAIKTFAVSASGATLDVSANGVKVADGGITATQIATSVAGNGLAGGGGTALSVNVDDSTIEINTDTLRVKDGGITNAKLENDGLMIGSTDISLGATGSSLAGLTSVTSTDFSGGTLSDTQLTGSFTGSFVGDGSNLTGLATTLTVDGDSGTANVALATDDLRIVGTTNETNVAVSKVGTDINVEVGLVDDVTIGGDLSVTTDLTVGANATVQGNLVVVGTASFQHSEDLDVADRFIRLASGSNSTGDGGIVIQQNTAANGEAFAYDAATTRWSFTGSFDPSTEAYTPDAFVAAVVEGASGALPTATVAKYTKNGNMFVSSSGEIFIYS